MEIGWLIKRGVCPQFTQLFSGFTKSLHFNCLEEDAPDTPQTQATSKTQLHVIFFSYEETHVSWTCKHLISEKVLNPELAINSRGIYHYWSAQGMIMTRQTAHISKPLSQFIASYLNRLCPFVSFSSSPNAPKIPNSLATLNIGHSP